MAVEDKEFELRRKVAIGTRFLAHLGILDYLGSVSARLHGTDRIWVVSAFGTRNPSRLGTKLRDVVCKRRQVFSGRNPLHTTFQVSFSGGPISHGLRVLAASKQEQISCV